MKKMLLLIPLALIVLVLTYMIYLGHVSRNMSAPEYDGSRLLPCPEKQNCICTEYPDDELHRMRPLETPEGMTQNRLADIITGAGGEIHTRSDTYIAATFRSKLFGYVDDLEVRIDQEQALIHFRSASRVGGSDLGVNRERVRSLKATISGAPER